MKITCATHSSYPRVGEGTGGQRLRQAYGGRERGELDDAAYGAVQDDVAREVLEEQAASGADLVTDGLVRWYDPISHVAAGLAGIEITGLVRWFDTNFYVRQPVVRARPTWQRPYLADEVVKAATSGRRVKAVVTGPYTLARHSIDPSALGLDALVSAYATALRPEIEAILAAGAAELQIDEPSLLERPSDIALVARGLDVMLPTGAPASLATYFGDVEPLYDRVQELPIAGLVLDLTYSPRAVARLASEGSRKRVALGILDGRNTALEPIIPLVRTLRSVINKVGSENVQLTTSCGLEYLPRDRARRKTEHLRAIARAVAEL